MSKFCPLINERVTYIFCNECDNNICNTNYNTCKNNCCYYLTCSYAKTNLKTPYTCENFCKREKKC
jgi:hypothetical protein